MVKCKTIFLLLLTFIFLFTAAGMSEAGFEGTVGTRFTITGSEFGIKKPKVYIEYVTSQRGIRKRYAKVETWNDTSITCLWTKPVYQGTYNLWVKPNVKGSAPVAEGKFRISNPVIDNVSPKTLSAGETITMTGQFFTNRKPIVYLEDLESSKRKRCRVLNANMDPSTGLSSLNFVVPKWESNNYEIILRTQMGVTSFALLSISGKVSDSSTGAGVAGVTMSLTGSGSNSVTTDADGKYSFTNIHNGSYTITPYHARYTFSPLSVTVTVNNSDITDQDFPGTHIETVDNWLWRNPLPQGNPLNGITFGNGTFVTVGAHGTALTSPDGAKWTSGSSDTDESLNGVTYGNGIFVTVGQHGTILTSQDGAIWTSKNSGTNQDLYGLTCGNGLFVAVGSSGTILSSPDGLSWTTRSSGTEEPLRGVSYGNGNFVAVGDEGTIVMSSDGVLWTSRPSETAGTALYFRAITFGNGSFVAAGYHYRGGCSGGRGGCYYFFDPIIWTSSDGVDWVQSYQGQDKIIFSITFGNGTFLAITEGSEKTIFLSQDGVTWSIISPVGYIDGGLAVAYGSDTFVSVGRNGAIATSPDGLTWTSGTSGVYEDLYGVTYGNGLFVAVGNTLLTSPDGAEWTMQDPGTTHWLRGVTYGNGKFVVWAGDRILTSPDGENWTNIIFEDTINRVAFGNGTFVAVGNLGMILTSPDGSAWTQRFSETGQNLNYITYGNGTFVAYGGSGAVITSPDGVEWTSHLYNTTAEHSAGITYGNNTFVAAGYEGIFTSPDGIEWTYRYNATDIYFDDVTYCNGIFVCIGHYYDTGTGSIFNYFLTSYDGVEWTPEILKVSSSLNQLTCGNGTIVAVGYSGTVVQSDPLKTLK